MRSPSPSSGWRSSPSSGFSSSPRWVSCAQTYSGLPVAAAGRAASASSRGAGPLSPPSRPSRPGRASRAVPQQLLVTGGDLAGTSMGLADEQITIGRANDATLVLTDDYASSRHARLFPQDGQWIFEDLGSTNGTYVDRQKVTQSSPVPVGVLIRIGKTVLEL